MCECGFLSGKRLRHIKNLMFFTFKADFWIANVTCGARVYELAPICLLFKLYSLVRNVIAVVTYADSIDCVRVLFFFSSFLLLVTYWSSERASIFFYRVHTAQQQIWILYIYQMYTHKKEACINFKEEHQRKSHL